jgi:hypothetical protein
MYIPWKQLFEYGADIFVSIEKEHFANTHVATQNCSDP